MHKVTKEMLLNIPIGTVILNNSGYTHIFKDKDEDFYYYAIIETISNRVRDSFYKYGIKSYALEMIYDQVTIIYPDKVSNLLYGN